jgi:hypothetical protein
MHELQLLTARRAYFGNQQFTTSHLVFVSSVIALQVHWDWAWTMQDFVIESCGTGLLIIGGVSRPLVPFSHNPKI